MSSFFALWGNASFDAATDDNNRKETTVRENCEHQERVQEMKKYVRYSDGAKMYSMGKTKFQELAKVLSGRLKGDASVRLKL